MPQLIKEFVAGGGKGGIYPPFYPPIFGKIGIPIKNRYTESTGRPACWMHMVDVLNRIKHDQGAHAGCTW